MRMRPTESMKSKKRLLRYRIKIIRKPLHFNRVIGVHTLVVLVVTIASLFANTMRIINIAFAGPTFILGTYTWLDHPVYFRDRGATSSWWLPRGTPDGNLTHPHLGARHPNGSYGMVVDPSIRRLREPSLSQYSILQNHSGGGRDATNVLCPTGISTFGIEGEGANNVMHKIRRGLKEAQLLLQSNNDESSLPGKPVRILCMIYTVHTPADNHSLQAMIADTWGRQCDGFIGASNMTDHEIGTIDLLHQGPEEYSNMWQKIRSMWTYAFDHYSKDYDYFYIAGDDTYVLVDHMRLFLQSEQVERLKNGHRDRIFQYYADRGYNTTTANLDPRPLVFGTPMMHRHFPVFSGGGGYILNQAALNLWGERGADFFSPDVKDPREDVFMGQFFFEHGVYLSDTQDDKGCWRFDSNAEHTSDFHGTNSWIRPRELKRIFGFEIQIGIDSASRFHISFHMKYSGKGLLARRLTIADLIARYHSFFSSWCPSDEQ